MSSVDSPGLSISNPSIDAVLIFDLDGTILSVNSFPYWVLYMLSGHFPGLSRWERVVLSIRTGQVLAKRKLLKQSHSHTKSRLQALWAQSLEKDAGQIAVNKLSSLLQGYVRSNLRSVMEQVASQRVDAILATSAAGEYAQGLAKSLGFSHVLTTPLCKESDKLENCGDRKRDRVLSLLEAQAWGQRPRIFFTDHEEDLPLIRECQLVLWFGRDQDMPAIRKNAPQTHIIACRNLQDTEIMRLASSL